jgi:hypothetical protein
MTNKTLIATLAASANVAFLFTLLQYASLSGRFPVTRLGYNLFVSVLPALGAFVVLKLTRLFVSLQGVVMIYLLLFLLVEIIQTVGRTIPISN